MFLDEIVGAVLQIGVFTLIPLIVYLITRRSVRGFANYIGFYAPTVRSVYLAILCSLIILITAIGPILVGGEFREALFDPESVTGKIRQMGFSINGLMVLLTIALFKTSFSEEILFRGFIAKRLIAKLGFKLGNVVQAIIFGLLHLVLFLALMQSSTVFLIYIFLLSGTGAYLMAWINEKVGKGSIVPGWIAHGLGNALSYGIIGFLI